MSHTDLAKKASLAHLSAEKSFHNTSSSSHCRDSYKNKKVEALTLDVSLLQIYMDETNDLEVKSRAERSITLLEREIESVKSKY